MSEAFVTAAAWWTIDEGPPRAELLPRDLRASGGFCARILAHALGRLPETKLGELPWVLGSLGDSPEIMALDSTVRRALAPVHGVSVVHADDATLAMTLIEALGRLVEHATVLVTFVQDATPPYREALAVAFLITRQRGQGPRLRLCVPRLHRSRPHQRPRPDGPPSFEAAIRLARAVDVGRPTVESIPAGRSRAAEAWQIELQPAP